MVLLRTLNIKLPIAWRLVLYNVYFNIRDTIRSGSGFVHKNRRESGIKKKK